MEINHNLLKISILLVIASLFTVNGHSNMVLMAVDEIIGIGE